MSKPKAVNFELISEERHPEIYDLLAEVRGESHEDIADAEIILAWRKALKVDKDGHLILGKCVKVSDLHKELAAYDFVILLNKEVWENPEFTIEKKKALLDHELCHAAPALDSETGEQKTDERGRPVWRIRKHDIEEFREVVERHGCYKADLEKFAEALIKSRQGALSLAASK
jgi:hypothetical protein